MNIWVVAIAEPTGTGGPQVRLLRAGTLVKYLLDAGHQVCWWNSTFSHSSKHHTHSSDQTIRVSDRYVIRLLHGCSYPKNVSLRRLLNHYTVARRFASQIVREPSPDLIVCSFPTIELSLESVRYGQAHGIPVILDIRDLWPDSFVPAVPRPLQAAARLAVRPYLNWTHEALSGAAALAAVSEGYLEWALRRAGRERGPADAVFVHGYDGAHVRVTPSERTAILRARNVNPSKTIVWFLGTMGSSYDLTPVIATARRLAQQGEMRAHFILSGDGPDRAAYEHLAADLHNVTFTGWIQREEIQRLMAVADIGLAAYDPGAWQGLPFKVFEYMAAGIPILSSLQGETAGLLQTNRCGLTYKAGSAESFSSMLMLLLVNERLRSELGRNGLSAFNNSYAGSRIYPAMVSWMERIGNAGERTVKAHC